jgi:hypothetical protein
MFNTRRSQKMKLILKAKLTPEVLEKLRKILVNHEIEWEEEVLNENKEDGQKRYKRLIKNRKGSFEI